jgi:2-iminobutanoate/2-iminopropanoate deaminase
VNRIVQPPTIAPPAANYAQAVLSTGSGAWLHTSGVVPTGADGTVPESLAAQAGVVWSNIAALLDAAAMTASDVVSVTTYVVVGEDLATVMAARDDFMGDHRAASTLVTVPALARPEWRLEVAVVATR